MNCTLAIKTIIANLKDQDLCLFTTGLISRRAYAFKDRRANFYMLGSMGLVSAVGLGIALNTDKKVILFDGDGSALMDLGTMAMIANYRPENLFHIVLDNQSCESTGGQPTISNKIELSKIAESMGFRKAFKFSQAELFQGSIGNILSEEGPIFVLLKLSLSETEKVPERVPIPPEKLTSRIKQVLS